MTTSYELSLKLKELGAWQDFGEYYWYMVYGNPMALHPDNLMAVGHDKLCRAFTLGELVRELPIGASVTVLYDGYFSADHSKFDKINITPEEAAGELYAEILKQKV